jgi:hypothetical protein
MEKLSGKNDKRKTRLYCGKQTDAEAEVDWRWVEHVRPEQALTGE